MKAAAMILSAIAACAAAVAAEAAPPVLSVDHYVHHRSTVPSIEGQSVQIYVRERTLASTVLRGAPLEDRVVLFVHGAGTPAEVAFDVPYGDYSWMAHHAAAGFDVFSMDVTGYGRSTRPTVMNDPCNLSTEQLGELDPARGGCRPSYARNVGTIRSDWDDIAAVVAYVTALRGVERVHLVGWSLGGPRAGGFAARFPDLVGRIVLLAPAYSTDSDAAPTAEVPAEGPAMTKLSRADFIANWNRQVGCENQYEPAVADAVWNEMLASDPVGATWGPGVRRAPRTTVWGFDRAGVAGLARPLLIVQGVHDAQIVPARAEAFFDAAGSDRKVLVDLGCASHNAMWERNHDILFDASLEWLERGTVRGMDEGVLRLGY